MQFLDRFDGPTRDRLMAAGRVQGLQLGELLIRRGERGGDIYYVEEGAFEVVDTRSTPEVVLDSVGPGAVLGEMAFIDAAPRTADVRATDACRVRVWEYEALNRVLDEEPAFAASFYRALAETTVERHRSLSTTAVVGGLGTGAGSRAARGPVADQARAIASRIQSRWVDADVQLRRDPSHGHAREQVRAGFALLLQESSGWLRSFGDPEEAAAAGAALSRELRAYLVRSTLAHLSLDPPGGRTGHPRQVAHVLLEEAAGDGPLGEVIDACFLALPTAVALRRRTDRAVEIVAAQLPPDRPAKLTLVNATCGALLAALIPRLARQGAQVRAVDGSREALSFLDAGLPARPSTVSLKLVQQDLGGLVLGRSSTEEESDDIVVLDALVDYLPDRLVASLLSWAWGQLAPEGVLVVTGLAPSPDAALFDHVLRWPMVRRTAAELRSLVETVGLEILTDEDAPSEAEPGTVITARRPGG